MVIRTLENVDYSWKKVRLFQIGAIFIWYGSIGPAFDVKLKWSKDVVPFSWGWQAEQDLLFSVLAGMSVDGVQELVEETLSRLIQENEKSTEWTREKASLWDIRSGLMRSVQRKLDLRAGTAQVA